MEPTPTALPYSMPTPIAYVAELMLSPTDGLGAVFQNQGFIDLAALVALGSLFMYFLVRIGAIRGI